MNPVRNMIPKCVWSVEGQAGKGGRKELNQVCPAYFFKYFIQLHINSSPGVEKVSVLQCSDNGCNHPNIWKEPSGIENKLPIPDSKYLFLYSELEAL